MVWNIKRNELSNSDIIYGPHIDINGIKIRLTFHQDNIYKKDFYVCSGEMSRENDKKRIRFIKLTAARCIKDARESCNCGEENGH